MLVLAACGSARETTAPVEQPEKPPADEFLVAGYHPWWLQGAWQEYDLSVYDEIYFFSVEVDSTGRIAKRNGWPDEWFSMQQELRAAGVRITPVVTLFSQSAFEQIFSTPEASAQLMETLLDLLRDSPAVGGLQLDFEVYQPVSPDVRANLTALVTDLEEQMEAIRPDLTLSLYVLAYDESDVFDEAALARAADYVVVQGYDLHGRTEGHTGPVSALRGWGNRNWMTVVNRLRDLGVPADKIVIGTPYYGYEWPAESAEPGAQTTGRGTTIVYSPTDTAYVSDSPPSVLEAVREHGLRRDPESGSPFYAYEDSTGWRQGWFEDAESLREKYAWVVEQGFRGVAVFPPAYGTPETDRLLREFFEPEMP